MRAILFLATLSCSGGSDHTVLELYGENLFGIPSKNTGLDASECAPTCEGCPEGFAPVYGPDDVAALRGWTLLDPPAAPTVDPYDSDPAGTPRTGACAVVDEGDQTYRLQHYPSEGDALDDGAIPTHGGPCGLCSSLQDLSVYMETRDLTVAARQCGLDAVGRSDEFLVGCLQDLGFTTPCATIWMFNSRHTQSKCIGSCLTRINADHHEEDGTLNPCLQCDEDESGEIFKEVAGRTRRNSGIPTALCRPCEEMWPFAHAY
ncbi:MAG: hypothetical protein KTR31_02920 [Myxococcales bacterium]|nr:hypothetical protein [Myxococcales bacterium]